MITARIGDIAVGVCPCPPTGMCPATGVVVTGDPLHLNGGSPTTRIGDIVMFPCGGFTIVTGMFQSFQGGMPLASIGSNCIGAGSGMIVTGNPLVMKS